MTAAAQGEMVHVRVTLEVSPTAEHLRALRRAIPLLGDLALTRVREGLMHHRRGLAGIVPSTAFQEAAETLGRHGIVLERVDWRDYDAAYVLGHLASPPMPASAERALTVLWRPSFTPEVAVRVWTESESTHLHLASREVSIWERDFVWPSWLRGEPDDARDLEHEHSEHAILSRDDPRFDDSLFDEARSLEQTAPRAGVDGVVVTIAGHDGAHRHQREMWCPNSSTTPATAAWLLRLLGVAKRTFTSEESRARLDEL